MTVHPDLSGSIEHERFVSLNKSAQSMVTFPGENSCCTGKVFAALPLELKEVHDPVRLPRDMVVSSTQVKRNRTNSTIKLM